MNNHKLIAALLVGFILGLLVPHKATPQKTLVELADTCHTVHTHKYGETILCFKDVE